MVHPNFRPAIAAALFVSLGAEGSAYAQSGAAQPGAIQLAEAPSAPAGVGRSSEPPPPAALDEVDADAKRFLEAGADFEGEIDRYVREKLAGQREILEASLEASVAGEDAILQERRLAAISYFEAFLARYPNHPEHTPNAMFKLAELYYEKDATAAVASGGAESEQGPSFADAIALYDELVRRFPKHRSADAALYVLGYLQDEVGELERSEATFERLVKEHPQSPFTAEAHLRMGEAYFEQENWDAAARAYQAALEFKDSRFYDKALYKLAWTHFQRFSYDEAIETFKSLLSWYENQGESTQGDTAAELRSEAIDYLARSLAEDDWNGDGEVDANAGVDRALQYLSTGEPYEREVLEAYATALYELHEQSKYNQAIDVLGRTIRKAPKHPDNPALHEKIVAIYDILGRTDEAAKARAETAMLFGPKSEWYRANQGRPEIIQKADALVELALRQDAQLKHKTAQDLRKQGLEGGDSALLVRAADAYRDAARAYAAYVESYPKSPHAADMEYLQGESLFFTGRFLDAAAVYARVRDTYPGGRNEESSAYSTVKALEKALSVEVSEGRLPPQANPEATADALEKAGEQPGSSRAPELVERWVSAVDTYASKGYARPDDPLAGPKLEYQAALVLSRLGVTGDARKRSQALLEKHTNDEVGGYAAALLVDILRREGDWDAIETWAKFIEERGIGQSADQSRLKEEVRVFRLGAQFQKAEKLLAEKSWVDAAREFERIVNADAEGSLAFADKAIYNAGLAYEEAYYYDSAARMFQRIVDEDRFKNSEFHDDALFRLAENHNRFFDFEQAARRYLALVQRNPKHAQAAYALFEAGRLLENDGKKKQAVAEYERYASLYPSRPDAADVLFRAVEVHRELGDLASVQRVARDVIERFAVVPQASSLVVQAHLALADAALAEKRTADAARLYQQVIAETSSRGIKPGAKEAAYAAKAQFQLTELKYDEYKSIRLQGGLDAMGKQIKRKQKLLAELEASYAAIFPYKALEWTFAGYYRTGALYEEFAQMLYKAPQPEGLSDEELEVYQLEIEDVGVRYEDTAVQRYQVTVDKARELKFKDAWTSKALEAVNRYKPAEYPLQREPHRAYTFYPLLAEGTLGREAAPRSAAPSEPPADGEPLAPPAPPSGESLEGAP